MDTDFVMKHEPTGLERGYMKLSFTKMQGCANDYIYLDCRVGGVPKDIVVLAQRLCVRHASIGADGIICICAPMSDGADATMRIFNADGSEGKMCGNGIRCVAQWLREHVLSCSQKEILRIDSLSGLKHMQYNGGGNWTVAMGQYSTAPSDLPARFMGVRPLVDVPLHIGAQEWKVTCICTGNPHCVTIVKDVAALKLAEIGPAFETHVNFPERINTEFVQVVDSTHLKMRVWERGSGETFACGTGTCASVAAMVEQGICARDTDVAVELLGGVLVIRVDGEGNLYMTGPAVTVYEGVAEV